MSLKRELSEARRVEEAALHSARQQAKAHNEALEALRRQVKRHSLGKLLRSTVNRHCKD